MGTCLNFSYLKSFLVFNRQEGGDIYYPLISLFIKNMTGMYKIYKFLIYNFRIYFKMHFKCKVL